MKKLISLIAVVALILGTFAFLVSCDDGKENAPNPSENQGNTDNGDTQNAPVAVASVNGMNAKQLCEAYFEKCKNSVTMDFSIVSVGEVENETVTETMDIKVGEDSMYIAMSAEENMKLWYVDGVTYVDSNEKKVKISASPAYIFGDNVLGDMLGGLPTPDKLPAQYWAKVESAQIYQLGDTYYMTISFTEAEIEQMNVDFDISLEETLYFDKNGNVVKSIAKDESSTTTATIYSLGGTVTVSAPSNASEFTDMLSTGVIDLQAYNRYTKLFDAVRDANSYVAVVSNDGQFSFEYEVDKAGDEYIFLSSGSTQRDIFMVGGKVYASTNNSAPVLTRLTPDLRDAFEAARQTRQSFLALKMPLFAMQYIDQVTDAQRGTGEIFLMVESGAQTLEFTIEYTYTSRVFESVLLEVKMYEYGTLTSTVNLEFYELNKNFDISV